MPQEYNIGADIGRFLDSCFVEARRIRMWRRARKDRREHARAEEAALKLVQGQMARGRAGDATEAQAHEALRGRGGRANKLDERWF